MEILRPRTVCISASLQDIRSCPSSQTSPSTILPGAFTRRMIRLCGHRFPGSALSDQPGNLSSIEPVGHAVDRLDYTFIGVEICMQPSDFEKCVLVPNFNHRLHFHALGVEDIPQSLR